MFTLENVESALHDPVSPAIAGEWLGVTRGAQLRLAGGSSIRLPIDPAGIHLGDPDTQTTDLFGGHALPARSIVMARGGFPTPLRFESASKHPELPALGSRTRIVLNAAMLAHPSGPVYGVGTFLHHEGGLRPGSNSVTWVDGSWFADRDDFAVALAHELSRSIPAVRPTAERNAYPWKVATLLLSGPPPPDTAECIRQLQLAAGLFRVVLRIEFDADARFKQLIQNIKSRPPNQLLVREHVGSGQRYIDQFRGFNPDGYADWISDGSQPHDLLRELICHLSLMSEMPLSAPEPLEWPDAGEQILAIVSKAEGALLLSDRAKGQLVTNPYPDPRRMVDHVRLLAEVATHYRVNSIGMRLEEFCASRGLTIALFDNSINPPRLTLAGVTTDLRAKPHVKVDDYVAPDRCGRIYFAIDPANARFVIDHIGLHDYS
ncbi:MAG: hypothetical protein J0I14_05735 [Propionibacteriaceae bacterium]|jgi:hypothetical protein|nr:hypothetical protein [Propionibacteriaceae bacterium]